MQILVDYRPALRERTGVGEYMHQLVRAYARATSDEVTVFTSSWKDRPAAGLASALGVRVVDRRIPVRVLNYLWHRAEWPPIETVAGRYDVVHAPHPLLIPARHAAQVITIHDLFFLSDPARTRGEIRRDYPALAETHARRAHAVITSTEYGRGVVTRQLGVPADRVYVCRPGAPSWRSLGRGPNIPRDGCVLFVGTLEPRKNLLRLVRAYRRVAANGFPHALVLAGPLGWHHESLMRELALRGPGEIVMTGSLSDDELDAVYRAADVFAYPSLYEGFGLPVVEAMARGVPTVASTTSSVPEVAADAAIGVNPRSVREIAQAIESLLSDVDLADKMAARGRARAERFSWDETARLTLDVYERVLGAK